MFVVWLAVRLWWSGRIVLRETSAAHVRLFAENALLGSGLLAAALLAAHIEPSEPTVGEVVSGISRSLGEAAWPVLCGLFSVVLARMWPYVVNSERGTGTRDSEHES